jgi:hypothetical protein
MADARRIYIGGVIMPDSIKSQIHAFTLGLNYR